MPTTLLCGTEDGIDRAADATANQTFDHLDAYLIAALGICGPVRAEEIVHLSELAEAKRDLLVDLLRGETAHRPTEGDQLVATIQRNARQMRQRVEVLMAAERQLCHCRSIVAEREQMDREYAKEMGVYERPQARQRGKPHPGKGRGT